MDLNRVRKLAGIPLHEDFSFHVDRNMHIYQLEAIIEKALKRANFFFTTRIGKPAFDRVIFTVQAESNESLLKKMLDSLMKAFIAAGLIFTQPQMHGSHVEFTIGERE